MSEERQPFMKVNDSDKQRGILPETQGHTTEEGGWAGRAKQHKWKIIGVVAVLLLALILGLTLGGKKKDNNGPGPTPPTPVPINGGYNPYYYDNSSAVSTEKNKLSGVLYFNDSVVHNPTAKYGLGMDKIMMQPSSIPIGTNNEFIRSASFDFSQVDYKITKVVFGDANKTRFSIPENLVNSKPDVNQMSLNVGGFSVKPNPFEFQIRSTRKDNIIMVNTQSSDFVMTDKFM